MGTADARAATAGWAGGGNRDRTGDLLHAMQALSQLSYTPNQGARLYPINSLARTHSAARGLGDDVEFLALRLAGHARLAFHRRAAHARAAGAAHLGAWALHLPAEAVGGSLARRDLAIGLVAGIGHPALRIGGFLLLDAAAEGHGLGLGEEGGRRHRRELPLAGLERRHGRCVRRADRQPEQEPQHGPSRRALTNARMPKSPFSAARSRSADRKST